MTTIRPRILSIALLASIVSVGLLSTAQASDQGETAKQVAVLKSDAPYFQKVLACKRLATIGTKEAVPTLAGFLGDAKMSHYARFALEPIPDPSVDAVLRDAAEKLDGLLQIGCINSLGFRKDTGAIELLGSFLKKDNPQLVAAAAAALGQIGTPEATALLKTALASAPADQKAALADSCLACAEELNKAGNKAAAIDLYDTVRTAADLPSRSVIAATRGVILTRGAEGKDLVLAQLQSDQVGLYKVGLETARMIPGDAMTKALLEVLPKLSAEKQAHLLSVLGDRGGNEVLALLIDRAKNGTGNIQIAALTALRTLDDASSVPALFAAATGDSPTIGAAARQTLVALKGKAVDQAILQELGQAKGNARLVAIELAGARRIAAATPELLKATADQRPAFQLAAITALGETCSLDDLPVLAKFSFATGDVVKPAQTAFLTACKRMPKDACCEKLASIMKDASVDEQVFLLNLIGTVGGTKALELAGDAAMSDNDAIQDAATQVLGKWFSPDVAPVLLNIAKNSKSKKYRVRCLRGYIRIFRQLGLPKEQKLAMAGEAMKLAERDEEKNLTLDAMSRIQSPEALAKAVEYLSVPALKAQAATTATTIGEKIAPTAPAAVAEAMQKVLDAKPSQELINKATIILNQTKK